MAIIEQPIDSSATLDNTLKNLSGSIPREDSRNRNMNHLESIYKAKPALSNRQDVLQRHRRATSYVLSMRGTQANNASNIEEEIPTQFGETIKRSGSVNNET